MHSPVNPSESEFAAFAEKGWPVVPLAFRAPNDGVLAWAAFAALEKGGDCAFLLESAAGEDGRYSYMGVSPRRQFRFEGGMFATLDGRGRKISESKCDDPLGFMQSQMAALQTPACESLPPFAGGVAGYMGYDCARHFEDIGPEKPDLLKIPDMLWMQTDWLAVFDHFRHELYLIKSCHAEDHRGRWRSCFRRARAEAEQMLLRMSSPPSPLALAPGRRPRNLRIRSNMTREQFCDAVRALKRRIRAGDIFQAVPSQRLSFPQPAPALDIYRCLRRMNPSPYMFYLKCGSFVAAGASPELMISCSGRRLEIRPIAGTRPRGADASEDAALEKDLLADEKEIAEHVMLVDLGRNDAGRVSDPGTVRVSRFCAVERYSHVMHIVSAVEGRLRKGLSAFDALRAAFPAGTLSGAPKVRAMQLINEIEPCRRNLYGGCAGFAGYDGGMMTCIAIRSFVAKDGMCHVQAGGGVVADSRPDNEYLESMSKAEAVLRAAAAAGGECGGMKTAGARKIRSKKGRRRG